MSLAFHACPPPGEWLNDPNGLVFADGQWRLFVQHRADGPAFRATGWARLSSPDLLDWTWDGPVIAPDGDDWAYSGSVAQHGDTLAATYTVHDAATGLERQARRTSGDAGASWSPAITLVKGAPNCRDPYVAGDGSAMLLARPCDWNDQTAASHLAIWLATGASWQMTGQIGPWHDPGIMWEVPVLVRVDGRDVLLVSTVDRRDGGADCSVRAWIGTFGPDGFTRDSGSDPEGQRLDFGPDFYAAMAAGGTPLVVGWLSSWATARAFAWPGFAGGVISLPRKLHLVNGRVRQSIAPFAEFFVRPVAVPPVAGRGVATIDGTESFLLTIEGAGAALTIAGSPRDASLVVDRTGHAPLPWHRRHDRVLAPCTARTLTIFVDGPVIELAIEPEGAMVSAVLPDGDCPFAIALQAGGNLRDFAWHVA